MLMHDEIIELLTAHKYGKTIQYRTQPGVKWLDWNPVNGAQPTMPTIFEWRVKPELKAPEVYWINTYDSNGDVHGVCHPTKSDADRSAREGRLECVKYVRASD
jgi:hypothetical protein